MGSLSLLQGIFPTQDLNRGLLHYRWILYQLSYQGSPWETNSLHKMPLDMGTLASLSEFFANLDVETWFVNPQDLGMMSDIKLKGEGG